MSQKCQALLACWKLWQAQATFFYFYSFFTTDEDIGTPILQISAFDVDEDSDLRYSIESITPDIPNQFSINNTTGEIYVGIELDYESNTFFTLEVGVEDLNTVPSGNSKDEGEFLKFL